MGRSTRECWLLGLHVWSLGLCNKRGNKDVRLRTSSGGFTVMVTVKEPNDGLKYDGWARKGQN